MNGFRRIMYPPASRWCPQLKVRQRSEWDRVVGVSWSGRSAVAITWTPEIETRHRRIECMMQLGTVLVEVIEVEAPWEKVCTSHKCNT
jgi:hypothetical protein